MNNCIFCKIINNKIPSKTIYEDDIIKVIMDINPSTAGHLLILPKKHYVNIMDINYDIIKHSIKITKEILYPKLKDKLHCEGLTIAQNNELGQEIKHFHIHLIPRYQDDGAEVKYNNDTINIDDVYITLTK